MKRLLALAACAAAHAHAATEADLARCRAVADASARLACYDALVPAAVAAPAPPAGATAPLPALTENSFGFENRLAQQGPEAVESRILGAFEGWGPNQRIRLENGQLWQIADDSRGVVDKRDPKVRITRGAMGSFLLEIEGRRQAPRVRRVE
jgi:hypothetical protein